MSRSGFQPPKAPYPIVGSIPRHGKSTIQSVAKDLLSLGGHVGALVREATDERRVGLAVLMIGQAAIRQLGPILRDAAHREASHDPPTMGLKLRSDESIAGVFDLMDAQKRTWFWWQDESKPDGFLVCFFVGAEVCEWLAPRLTEAGCPTSLT